MTAMDTVTETSTQVLESLDYEIPCDHSRHHDSPYHEGPAAFIAKVTHYCPKRPEVFGNVYVCCAKWADKVVNHMEEPWICPVCNDCQLGKDMCIIVGPLDVM